MLVALKLRLCHYQTEMQQWNGPDPWWLHRVGRSTPLSPTLQPQPTVSMLTSGVERKDRSERKGDIRLNHDIESVQDRHDTLLSSWVKFKGVTIPGQEIPMGTIMPGFWESRRCRPQWKICVLWARGGHNIRAGQLDSKRTFDKGACRFPCTFPGLNTNPGPWGTQAIISAGVMGGAGGRDSTRPCLKFVTRNEGEYWFCVKQDKLSAMLGLICTFLNA